MIKFEKFKKVFDESFGKITPDEFIQRMKNLGYEFQDKIVQKRICDCEQPKYALSNFDYCLTCRAQIGNSK